MTFFGARFKDSLTRRLGKPFAASDSRARRFATLCSLGNVICEAFPEPGREIVPQTLELLQP